MGNIAFDKGFVVRVEVCFFEERGVLSHCLVSSEWCFIDFRVDTEVCLYIYIYIYSMLSTA